MSPFIRSLQNSTTNEPGPHWHAWEKYEFFVILLPSYVFLIVGTLRYLQIRHTLKTFRAPYFEHSRPLKRMTGMMTAIYILKFFIGIADPQSFNLMRSSTVYFFLYLFPIAAWIWSYWLLQKELKRKFMPKDYEQLLFWASTSFLILIKLVFEYKV
jgi:hypothetical protein